MLQPPTHPLIVYEWTYGVTECLHILGFAVAVGSISLIDLHLVGLGFTGRTPAAMLRDTAIWTIGGLAVTIAAGLVILSTDAERYLTHPTMQLKLATLGIAIVYHYTVHAAVARRAATPTRLSTAVAAISLLLWTSIIFDGIFYAFT